MQPTRITAGANTVRQLSRDRDHLGRYIGATRQCCPVCWQWVTPTPIRHNIEGHLDSAGLDMCPASGEPYRITIAGPAAAVRRLTA